MLDPQKRTGERVLASNEIILVKSDIISNLENALKMVGIEDFTELGKVAVKLHMGEYGNLHYIRPPIVGRIVEILKDLGNSPYLFDTPTLYPGSRETVDKYLDTARRNGFCEEVVGCPILISDNAVRVPTNGVLGAIEVARALYEADGILVLSHGKGHPDLGYGGAIKNLAMGGVARNTKKDIHTESQPILAAECSGCGECVSACTQKGVSLKDGKAVFNYENCFGCGICIETCPVGALEPRKAPINELFSETFLAMMEAFDRKPLLFINVLMDITPRCDCFPSAGEDEGFPICDDVGVLLGRDATSIDNASIDLIAEKCGNVFERIHHVDPLKLMNTIKADIHSKGLKLVSYVVREF